MVRAIDADALIKVFQHKLENNIFPLCVISTIEEAPTIDPVKHGKWIDTTKIRWVNETNVPVVMCTECGIRFCDLINNHHYMYHFCPNCGARMDGE